MRALIIADRSLASRERAMLARLSVGLADEGVRVIHAVPQSLADSGSAAPSGLYSTRVTYAESVLPMFVRSRARALFSAIQDADDSTEPLDIVHAFGIQCWPLAMHLGDMTGAAVHLEVWQPALIAPAVAMANMKRFDAPAFLVSEPAISAEIRKRAPRARIFSAPWGVHDTGEPLPARTGNSLSIALLCDMAEPKAVASVLGGIADVAKSIADLLVFADVSDPGLRPWQERGPVGRQANVWSAARKLGLLDRLTLTPDMEGRREPVLHADMLVLPEAHGMQRTLLLEAMSCGIPIVALADPYLSSLIDGRTARLLSRPSSADWADAIRSLLRSQDQAQSLGRSAQEFVRANRRVSEQIAGVLRAYQAACVPADAAPSPS